MISYKYDIIHHLLYEIINSIRQKLQLLLMNTNRPCILQRHANHNKPYIHKHTHMGMECTHWHTCTHAHTHTITIAVFQVKLD